MASAQDCVSDFYTQEWESACGQKATTANPSNRMRPVGVTQSQLSCLRSALDAGKAEGAAGKDLCKSEEKLATCCLGFSFIPSAGF